MIQKKHFHIIEAVSVLMFAVLANFIFGLKIDFCQRINWIQVIQLVILTIAVFVLYFMVYLLKNLYEEAVEDDKSEENQETKANFPVEKRYKIKYDSSKKRIYSMIIISVICTLMFFLVEPIVKYFFF
jgi:formate hydrogenlyase subunit 3/multisubunit Na+/H+ antiporter MnhD subunit